MKQVMNNLQIKVKGWSDRESQQRPGIDAESSFRALQHSKEQCILL